MFVDSADFESEEEEKYSWHANRHRIGKHVVPAVTETPEVELNGRGCLKAKVWLDGRKSEVRFDAMGVNADSAPTIRTLKLSGKYCV